MSVQPLPIHAIVATEKSFDPKVYWAEMDQIRQSSMRLGRPVPEDIVEFFQKHPSSDSIITGRGNVRTVGQHTARLRHSIEVEPTTGSQRVCRICIPRSELERVREIDFDQVVITISPDDLKR